MDAFVTGGSGFVGTHLLERLESEDGIDTVRALARSKESARVVEACGATAVRGDLSDLESMIDGMCDCDTVFHLAAKADRWGRHENFAEVNVRGTENVVQAAREAGVETLVHTSTEAVLADGTPLRNVDETTRYSDDPISRYPETNGEAKKRVLDGDDEEPTTVAVRPRFVWGPRDRTLLPEFASARQADPRNRRTRSHSRRHEGARGTRLRTRGYTRGGSKGTPRVFPRGVRSRLRSDGRAFL